MTLFLSLFRWITFACWFPDRHTRRMDKSKKNCKSSFIKYNNKIFHFFYFYLCTYLQKNLQWKTKIDCHNIIFISIFQEMVMSVRWRNWGRKDSQTWISSHLLRMLRALHLLSTTQRAAIYPLPYLISNRKFITWRAMRNERYHNSSRKAIPSYT